MPIQKLRPTFTFDEDRMSQLRAIVPEAFADGKVNWDVLKEAMGEHLEDEDTEAEHFGLFWPGKREARRLASIPSQGTLAPQTGLGISEDETHNLFIEGDNLEVLKILQKSYAGRVKMIYIDPPYNTGNDFVYSDDYREPLEHYLRHTGQADDAGRLLTTNTRASGRFHSKWLTMMYPRLRLARQLLRDDGAIIISIDDNEVNNLRLLMDEVFGEKNFVATVPVRTNPRGRSLDRFIAKTHEYIMIFVKSLENEALFNVPKTERALAEYSRQESDGRWFRELELRNRNPVFNRSNRPNLYFPIYADPATGSVSLSEDEEHRVEVLPRNSQGVDDCWSWSTDKVERENHLLFARQVNTGAWRVFRKDYLTEKTATTKAKSIWIDKSMNHENGKEALRRLFDGASPFDFPKSIGLLRQCLIVGSRPSEEHIILDFFAGSCTIAQAVLELNCEDDGNRRFIVVQLPERAEHSGYSSIADIGRERIRRVVKQRQTEDEGKLSLLADGDLGFRCYRLARSNFKPWQDVTDEDIDQLEMAFDGFETPLIENWQRPDLLTEILLAEGFPLDSTVRRQERFTHNQVDAVSSDFHEHRLFICLDENISPDTVSQLDLARNDVFVCRDSALDDETKLRLSDTGSVHVI